MVKIKEKRVKNKFKYSLTSATTNVLTIDLKQGYYQNTQDTKNSYILYTTDISETKSFGKIKIQEMVHSKNNNKMKVGIEILIPDAIEFKNTKINKYIQAHYTIT